MRWMAVIMVALFLGACDKRESASTPPPAASSREQVFSTDSLMRGAQLYQQHCAQCHGPEAQGHPDWKNPQVIAAAPPLNGTGKETQRRRTEMIAVIRNGVSRDGQPTMPAWKGRLSDAEIDDIIAWYQALWAPEVYERWRKAELPDGPRG